jgi:hypothetical protein
LRFLIVFVLPAKQLLRVETPDGTKRVDTADDESTEELIKKVSHWWRR